MTLEEAVTMVGGWPDNRNVPRLLRDAIDAADGEHKENLGEMVEILLASSLTKADTDLVSKFFG
jgi:hypothetical protein|tara:strand:- start:72 stop:263 length:192 start_codon:yes stop_codon:yes gene_type:complete